MKKVYMCPRFKKKCIKERCSAYCLQHGRYLKLQGFTKGYFIQPPKFEQCEIIRGYCKEYDKVIKEVSLKDEPR